tara:strand:+ start:166 stop:345 length:180 start_codon:yes stop_codon:yes gene_type:complete
MLVKKDKTMADDNERISVAQQVKRINAAYASMYAPKEEAEVNEEEIETQSEEDTDVTTT